MLESPPPLVLGDYNVTPSLVHSTFRTDPAAVPATGLQPRLSLFVVDTAHWLIERVTSVSRHLLLVSRLLVLLEVLDLALSLTANLSPYHYP